MINLKYLDEEFCSRLEDICLVWEEHEPVRIQSRTFLVDGFCGSCGNASSVKVM